MLYKYIIKFFFFHFLVNINNNLIDLDVADKSAKKKYILIIIIKKKINNLLKFKIIINYII